jgi:hypothetical protein
MLRIRGKEAALGALIIFTSFFIAGCCCENIIEKVLDKYDYVKGVHCRTEGVVKGCLTIEEQAHLEVKVKHEMEIEEACVYHGENEAPQMNVGFRLPDTMENTGQAVCFEFNGDAISFDPDPVGQAELEDQFGGTWVAYLARDPVFPSLTDSVMDEMHFSYDLTFTVPFSQGVNLQDVEYDIAVREPDTGLWMDSPTTRRLDFDTVLIGFSDSRLDQLPIIIAEGETLGIERVFAMLKNDTPLRVDAYLVIKQGDTELVRNLLVSPLLPANVPLGPFLVNFPTDALGPGLYTARIEATGHGQPDVVLGSKSVPFRVE